MKRFILMGLLLTFFLFVGVGTILAQDPAKVDTTKKVEPPAETPKAPSKPDTTKALVKPPSKPDTTKALAKPQVYKYVGAMACKGCHNLPTKGKQFDKWAASKHAIAYKTLASEASKALATKMDIADSQKSDKCLPCHITGYGVADSLKGAKYLIDEGVTCEACHGPGEKYKTMNIMKDKALAMKNGLIEPTKELCITCHNKQSPTYKEFKFEEAVKAIDHSYPKKQETKPTGTTK
jgi:hypothetical protein